MVVQENDTFHAQQGPRKMQQGFGVCRAALIFGAKGKTKRLLHLRSPSLLGPSVSRGSNRAS